MRNLAFTLFCFLSIGIFAQQTITQHEIKNDVQPSGKLELYYSNTSFPINEFFVGEKYTMLFSRYTQAFYLLENKTGLIVDQLFMKDIEGLKSSKMIYRMQEIRNKYKVYYDMYLAGHQGVISKSITRINDTLFYCGMVRSSGWDYGNFYVSWSQIGKLQYNILDNVPVEKDFMKPEEQYEIAFNRNSLLTNMAGHYYYPKNSYLLLTRSPWEKVDRKPQCVVNEVVLCKRNAQGKFFPALELNEKQGPLYNLFIDEKQIIFYNRTLQKNFLVLSGDSILLRIPHPGKNYGNWLVKDVTNGDIYLFSDIYYKNETDRIKLFDEYSREGEYDKSVKLYDIYRLDQKSYQFKNVNHLKITGKIAQYLNENTSIYLNDATFRVHDGQVYLNIPVYSPDEQLGIYKVQLEWTQDTTIIPSYQKQEFAFIKDLKSSHKEIVESILFANHKDYHPLPGKFANVITDKRFYKNRATSITMLMENISDAIETTPLDIPVKFVAYDQ